MRPAQAMAPSPSRALLFRAASARSALWRAGYYRASPDRAWRDFLPAFPGVSDRRSSHQVVPPYRHRDVHDSWVGSEAQRCRTLVPAGRRALRQLPQPERSQPKKMAGLFLQHRSASDDGSEDTASQRPMPWSSDHCRSSRGVFGRCRAECEREQGGRGPKPESGGMGGFWGSTEQAEALAPSDLARIITDASRPGLGARVFILVHKGAR